ncbi:MAG: hypothetical protein RSF33_07260 [Hydrogenoanaerobacterium sp.]
MTDINVLKERKICAVCVDCTDQDCLTCNKVNGSTLAEINIAFDNAIQALEEKAERDKMRCENCKYFYCHSAVDRLFHCRHMQGLKCINVVEDTPFCSYFEPKESEGNDA